MTKALAYNKIKSRVLTVTLNPAIDETINFKDFKAGQTYVSDDVKMSAGGKGVNVSRVLKRLRVSNTATGLIGGDTGLFIEDALTREKILSRFVRIKQPTRTSLTIIGRKSGKITRVLQHGPRVTRQEIELFKDAYDLMLRTHQTIVIAGRNANGAYQGVYADLIKKAHAMKRKVILDAHGPAFKQALTAKPFCISPNKKEAEEALGYKMDSLSQLKKGVNDFQCKGVDIVFISLGKGGAIGSINGQGIWLAKPPVIKQKNSVGCGDSFIGGFIYASLKNVSFKDVLRLAVASGTVNAMTLVPGNTSVAAVRRMARRVKIRKIS